MRTEAENGANWQDLRELLDAALRELPERYRVPLLLCYWQGHTHEEAARQLGWPKGTVSGRLARARELLRKRLTRRGVPLTVGLLAATLSAGPAPAARLAGAAAEAARLFAAGKAAGPGVISARAVLLAEGVLKAMFWTKIKITTALLLAVRASTVKSSRLRCSRSTVFCPTDPVEPRIVTRLGLNGPGPDEAAPGPSPPVSATTGRLRR